MKTGSKNKESIENFQQFTCDGMDQFQWIRLVNKVRKWSNRLNVKLKIASIIIMHSRPGLPTCYITCVIIQRLLSTEDSKPDNYIAWIGREIYDLNVQILKVAYIIMAYWTCIGRGLQWLNMDNGYLMKIPYVIKPWLTITWHR